jgi:hypothetical protein
MSLGDHQPAATGIAGLDDILRGGFPTNHVYLIQGDPRTPCSNRRRSSCAG